MSYSNTQLSRSLVETLSHLKMNFACSDRGLDYENSQEGMPLFHCVSCHGLEIRLVLNWWSRCSAQLAVAGDSLHQDAGDGVLHVGTAYAAAP